MCDLGTIAQANRKRLNELLKQKRKIEEEITSLTRASDGVTYGKHLQVRMEQAIMKTHPGIDIYHRTLIYNEFKRKLYKITGVESKVITGAELEEDVKILRDLGLEI